MRFELSATSARALAVLVTLAGGASALTGACSGKDGGADADAGASTSSSSGSSGASSSSSGQPQVDCAKPADCPSKVCTSGKCADPTDKDGVKNGSETDTDCGGPAAPKCDVTKTCGANSDCLSGSCSDKGDGKKCQPPAPDDGVKNGTETDIDCGGAGNPKCSTGKACKGRDDCASLVCVTDKCEEPTPADGEKNGTETDVDCGGPTAPPCNDGLGCTIGGDCSSKVCKTNKCQVPSPTDGVMNGTETDLDCGGSGNPKCATTKSCLIDTDCSSDGCDYNKKCALRRSCTARNGGDTCGLGGPGGRGAAQWESCCKTAPVTVGGATTYLDKYKVTSGRMREFLRRTGGNVRAYIKAARLAGQIPAEAIMLSDWDPYLPVSMGGNNLAPPAEVSEPFQGGNVPADNVDGVYTGVYAHLGGLIFYQNNLGQTGCYVNAPGTHTYWMPKAIQEDMGDIAHEHSQAEYDTKALNCVNYLMAQAFCIWDGGRLQSAAEYQAAWGAANASQMPWGATPTPKGQDGTFAGLRFPTTTDALLRADPAVPAQFKPSATQSIEYASYLYSYEYPNLVTLDYAVHVNAPGRLLGRSAAGHADIIGPAMEATSTLTPAAGSAGTPRNTRFYWAGSGSFEGHGWGYNSPWPASFHLLNKYGKQGARCVYPTAF